MKTKVLYDSFVQRGSTTDATEIVELETMLLNGGKITRRKFKFSYYSGNAFERFQIELFDGDKLNPIANMIDLNVAPNSSAYNIFGKQETLERVNLLMKKGYEYIKLLY